MKSNSPISETVRPYDIYGTYNHFELECRVSEFIFSLSLRGINVMS